MNFLTYLQSFSNSWPNRARDNPTQTFHHDEGHCSWGDRKDKADSVQGIFPREIGNEPYWLRALSFHMLWNQETKLGAHVAKGRICTYYFCSSATNLFHLLISSQHVWYHFLLAAPPLTLNSSYLTRIYLSPETLISCLPWQHTHDFSSLSFLYPCFLS